MVFDDVGGHHVDQFPEGPQPDSLFDASFLDLGHVDGFFHFDDTDSTQGSYIGYTVQFSGRTQSLFEVFLDLFDAIQRGVFSQQI